MPRQSQALIQLALPAAALELCWLGLRLFHPIFSQPWPFQALFAAAFLAFGVALAQAHRHADMPHQLQQALVLAGALLFQLTLLPAPYAFSDDIFRYVWDGRVSATGIDPYRYPPGDPALAALRDDLIWPNVNAKEQPSPYPPLLETTFALIYRIAPESLSAMKAAMIGLNMGVIGLLIALLRRRGEPPLLAIIYAWNPQVVFQVAFSGHNEPLMLFWLLTALLLGETRSRSSYRRVPMPRMLHRQLLGAWALALAALAKLVPLLALPLVFVRWGWQAALVFCATIGAVYGALLLRGQAVFSGAVYEASSAQFNDGVYYLFYKAFQLLSPIDPHMPARLLAGACLTAVIVVFMLRRGTELATSLGCVMAAYLIFTLSVAPWYALWVLPFVALDALPRLARGVRRPPAALWGSYWLVFSWSVTLSELFYFTSRPTWRVAHVLVYAMPLGAMLVAWLWSLRTARHSYHWKRAPAQHRGLEAQPPKK